MEMLRLFDILMLVGTVLWVLAVVIYSLLFGSIEFGPLGVFAVKSVGLLMVANTLGCLPFVGGWLELAVYWLGIMWLFKMDFWEARMLTFIVWAVNLLAWLAVLGIMARK